MAITRTFLGSNTSSNETPISTFGVTVDTTGYTNAVVYVKHEGAPTTISVSDNKGSGTYIALTKVDHSSNGALSGGFHHVKLGSPGTSTTITMTLGAAKTFCRIMVWGVNSGLGSMTMVVPERTTQDSASTLVSMLDIETAAPCVAFMACGEFDVVTYNQGSGWLKDFDTLCCGQSRAEASPTTITPSFTYTPAMDHVASAVAFVESAPGIPYPSRWTAVP